MAREAGGAAAGDDPGAGGRETEDKGAPMRRFRPRPCHQQKIVDPFSKIPPVDPWKIFGPYAIDPKVGGGGVTSLQGSERQLTPLLNKIISPKKTPRFRDQRVKKFPFFERNNNN